MNLVKNKLSDSARYNYVQYLNELNDLISENNQIVLIDSSVVKKLPFDDEFTIISLLASNTEINIGETITKEYNDFLGRLNIDDKYVSTTKPENERSYSASHRITDNLHSNKAVRTVSWNLNKYSIYSKPDALVEFQDPKEWIKLVKTQKPVTLDLGNYCTIIGTYDRVNRASYFSFIYSKNEIGKEHFERLVELNFEISLEIVNHIIEDLLTRIKQKSLQSSLTSIMSRNQSHNLGSHVLNNLSNENIISKFYKNGLRDEYLKSENVDKRYFLSGEKEGDILSNYITKENLDPIPLISTFNSYLKSRMDFIADVGTSDSPTVFNSSNLFQDVFALFEKNLLLLREISGKEDNFNYSFCLKTNNEIDKIGPLVSLPNALLGQQAFYVLLENIIRNTAKHEVVINDKVIFHINCKNESTKIINDDFISIEIYSDINYSEKVIQKLVQRRNENINENVLNKGNAVRDKSWGTIEMKVAAAYLSGIKLTEIDHDIYNVESDNHKSKKYFPLIEAICVKGNDNQYFFGYRFHLRKPKLALIACTNNDFSKLNESVGSLDGIDIITLDNEKLITKTFTHEFLIVFGEANIDRRSKNWPQRIIILNDLEVFLSKNKIEDVIWSVYYNQILKKKFQGDLKIGTNGFDIVNKGNKSIFRFDRHGSLINEVDTMKYHEPYGSSSILGHLLFNQKFKRNKTLLYKCMEAVQTKVLIIDERIQSATKNSYRAESKGHKGVEIDFKTIYSKTGVIIPDYNEINLNQKDLSNTENLNILLSYIRLNITNCDFLVMHFGILEMLNKLDQNILNDIKSMNENCRIVLISGRGRTKDIPASEHFINQSSFSYFLTNPYGRSKLHLNQLLMATR